jgi:FkbM family methyltransferase
MYIYRLKKEIENQPKYKSSSQFNEDLYLVEIFKANTGMIVDVGANDGIFGSNSKLLETLSWGTVLIEPNQDLCNYINTHRKPSYLFQNAASSKEGEVILYLVEGSALAHGLSTLEPTKENIKRLQDNNFTYKEVKVFAKKLDKMLAEANVRKIDVVSIDVEGHELDVLRGFSVDIWKPTIVIVEDNSYYKSDEVAQYMKSYGYVRFFRTGVNDWYARRENKELINWKNTLHYNFVKRKSILLDSKINRLKLKIKKIRLLRKLNNFLKK